MLASRVNVPPPAILMRFSQWNYACISTFGGMVNYRQCPGLITRASSNLALSRLWEDTGACLSSTTVSHLNMSWTCQAKISPCTAMTRIFVGNRFKQANSTAAKWPVSQKHWCYRYTASSYLLCLNSSLTIPVMNAICTYVSGRNSKKKWRLYINFHKLY